MAMGFDYSIAPDKPRVDCCYEIEVVIEKITPPKYAAMLRLSVAATAAIDAYRAIMMAPPLCGFTIGNVMRLEQIGRWSSGIRPRCFTA